MARKLELHQKRGKPPNVKDIGNPFGDQSVEYDRFIRDALEKPERQRILGRRGS